MKCSVILHIKTQKGKGYAPAEADPNTYHGLPPRGMAPIGETFSARFGTTLCALAEQDTRLCAITAAMCDGTGLAPFRAAHPQRFFDVGIAEEHAVTFAAGLAAGGKRPVVAVYSTFLQRAYDQILHDAVLQKLPVVFAIDRAGFNANDGVTHHGVFDVAMLAPLTGLSLYTPVTLAGLDNALRAALSENGPAALRYAGGTENEAIRDAFFADGVGNSPRVRTWQSGQTPRVTVVTHGRIAAEALASAEVLRAEGIAMRILLLEQIMPYAKVAADVAPLLDGAPVVFYEEEVCAGGFGMNLAAALARQGQLPDIHTVLGAGTGFAVPAAGETNLTAAGVDAAALTRAIKNLIEEEERNHADG